MYIIASPTELEIRQLKENRELERLALNLTFLVTGFGMAESAISLTQFLSEMRETANHKHLDGIIVFGGCGAYMGSGTEILDICLAEDEHFGDFGTVTGDEIEYFTEEVLRNKCDFDLRNDLFKKIERNLAALQIPYRSGSFVTVNSCTGTLTRGNFLRDKFNAVCENMEGAALARVCEAYGVPLAELRCVSNMVEDRDKAKWKIEEAITKGSEVLAKLLLQLLEADYNKGV